MPCFAHRRLAILAATALAVVLALAPVTADAQNQYAAQVEVRLSQLERQIQLLTGQLEQLQYQNQQLTDQLQRALYDMEYRLTILEGGTPEPQGGFDGGSTGGFDTPTSPPDTGLSGAEDPFAPLPLIPPPRSDLTPIQPTPGPDMVTGSTLPDYGNALPQGEITSDGYAVAARGPVMLPAGDPSLQYDYAFGFIRSGDYVGAEQAMGQFLSANPNSGLAGNAQYWLGESYFAQGRYEEAAAVFSEGYSRFPDGAKAVDSLLKLGLSLSLLRNDAQACNVFVRLRSEYPSAAPAVLRRADEERSRLMC